MDTFSPVATLLFLLSLVLLGMPHGAIDHLVFFRAAKRSITAWNLGLFIVAYIGVVAIFFLLWIWQPVICALAFLGLTAWHWGEGDRVYEWRRGNSKNAAFAWFRGSIPMMIPVIVHPESAIAVLEAGARVGGSVDPQWSFLEATWMRILLLAGLITLGWLGRGADGYSRRLTMENLGLITLFALLPPLVAIAFYFVGWHSLRHIRVIAQWMKEPIGDQKGRVNWAGFSLHAFPFTIPAVAAVGWMAWRDQAAGMAMDVAWVGSYLIWLWALTWPHSIVCLFAERKMKLELRPEPLASRNTNVSVEVST